MSPRVLFPPIRRSLSPILFLSSLLASACVVAPPPGRVYVAPAPPPPRAEIVTVAPGPGYIWVGGRWRWNGDAYYWVPGSWLAPAYGHYRWVPGHWAENRRGWYWAEGHWR